MPSKGHNSWFIIGEQDAGWDTPAWLAKMDWMIYEMVSSTLKNTGPPPVPNRLAGHPSPPRQLKGMMHGEGDIAIQLHADNMFRIWAQLMQATDSERDSTDFTPQEVFGNGEGGMKMGPTGDISLDTQPNATDPTSDPGILRFMINASDSGIFTIAGKDQNNMAITETVALSTATTGASAKYFKTVDATGINATGFAAATTGLYIESDKDTYTHVITLGDGVLDGLTIEEVKGNIPSVYVGSIINAGAIALGDTLTLASSILSKQGWNRYKVSATTGDLTASATPTDVSASGWSRVTERIFPAWGLSLFLEGAGTATGVESAAFTLNNQLVFPTRYRSVRTPPKPVRNAPREVSLVATIDYDTVNSDYDLKMLNNQVMQAKLVAYHKPYAGPEYSIQLDFPRCQITAFPDPDVSDFSQVAQELSLNAIRSEGASSSDEVKVTLVNRESGAA